MYLYSLWSMCDEESYILTRKAALIIKFDSFMCAQLGKWAQRMLSQIRRSNLVMMCVPSVDSWTYYKVAVLLHSAAEI
jgi:hypothetical protein